MIKKFLSQFTKKPKTPEDIFLALEIDNEKVNSSLWQVITGEPEVLKLGSLEEWQESSPESLLLSTDASVSKALENVSQEPKGVIFGLPETWVRDDQILPSYKEQLRLICEKLSLKPLGFVVTTEALLQYLRKEEGLPLSAIFVKVEESEVVVSLVKLGKIKGTKRVGRSDDLGADTEEALVRFGEVGALPSRILLFDGLLDFEEARQQLISFSWQNLNFLHLPKVDVLESRTTIKAIAIAGGKEVAKSLGFNIKDKPEEKIHQETIQEETISEKETLKRPEDLGFFEGEIEAPVVEEKIQSRIKEEKMAPIVEGEIRKEKKSFKYLIPFLKKLNPVKLFQKLALFFPGKLRFSVVFGAGLSFLLLVVFFFFFYGHRALITLYLEPKVITESLKISLDPNISANQEGVIKAERKTVNVEGAKQMETTGKKLIGEKAKGRAVFYNKTQKEEIFPKDTVLIGPEGLTFNLNEEVKVASRSAEEGTFGKANAEIEAGSIGTEGNLEAETKLAVKGFPQDEFSAKIEDGLSGGTSREIRAVAKEDLIGLKEALLEELRNKAQEELQTETQGEIEIFEESQEEIIKKEEFSHQEGDETASLSLNLGLELSLLTFSHQDLLSQLKDLLESKIGGDFLVAEEGITTNILDGKMADGKAELTVEVQVKLQPKIQIEDLRQSLSGKKVDAAESILKETPNFSRTEVKISPPIPGLINRLPYRKENIKIEIKVL